MSKAKEMHSMLRSFEIHAMIRRGVLFCTVVEVVELCWQQQQISWWTCLWDPVRMGFLGRRNQKIIKAVGRLTRTGNLPLGAYLLNLFGG
jgi:hypothetical protein